MRHWVAPRAIVRDRVPDFRIPRSALRDPSDSDQVAWDVIERLYNELRTPYEPDDRLTACTRGQRALYALHWTRSEVVNGGFEQFFVNPTGYLWPEAAAGATQVGADDYGEVIARAGQVFPGGRVPSGQQERQLLLGIDLQADPRVNDARSTLEECDEAFFALLEDDERTLSVILARYVEKHPEEFFTPERASRETSVLA
jgi:hypothetical protein